MTDKTDQEPTATPASPLTEALLAEATVLDRFVALTMLCLEAYREAISTAPPTDLDAARRGEVAGDQGLAALAAVLADLPTVERELAEEQALAARYRRYAEQRERDREDRRSRWQRREELRRHEERSRAYGVREPTPEAAYEQIVTASRKSWAYLGELHLRSEVVRDTLDPRRKR